MSTLWFHFTAAFAALRPKETGPMSLREYLNNNSAVATILAVVLLVVALGAIVWQNSGGPGGRSLDAFYLDLNTGELFVDRGAQLTPFDRGTGERTYADGGRGSAVRAVVLTCGDPADVRAGMTVAELESVGAFVAYVQRLSPRARDAQQRQADGETLTDQEQMMLMDGGFLISDPAGETWIPEMSEAAQNLIASAYRECGNGERPLFVRP
ncbi:MAG: hypothetical protein AAF710_01855 [Planctomycetota bacterium]